MPRKSKFPRLRVHVKRGKAGQVWISHWFDMRGTGQPDIPLGTDRADAERYRWLRDPNNMHAREIVRYYGDVEASELDAAIDAAMKADKDRT